MSVAAGDDGLVPESPQSWPWPLVALGILVVGLYYHFRKDYLRRSESFLAAFVLFILFAVFSKLMMDGISVPSINDAGNWFLTTFSSSAVSFGLMIISVYYLTRFVIASMQQMKTGDI